MDWQCLSAQGPGASSQFTCGAWLINLHTSNLIILIELSPFSMVTPAASNFLWPLGSCPCPPQALQTHRGATGASTRTTAHGPATSPTQNPQPSLQSPSTTEISRPTWFYRVQTFNEEIMLILHNLIQKREGIIPSLAQEASIMLEKKWMRTENKQNPHTRVPHDRKHHLPGSSLSRVQGYPQDEWRQRER